MTIMTTIQRLTRIEYKLDMILQLQGITLADLEEIIAAGDNTAAQLILIAKLKASADALKAATAANQSKTTSQEKDMASSILDALAAQVKANTDAEDSATLLINGFAARVQTAVDAAIAGGATAAELAPVQAEVDAMTASAAKLSAAVVANTPAAP